MKDNGYTAVSAALLLIACGREQADRADYPSAQIEGNDADESSMQPAAGEPESRKVATRLETSEDAQLDGQAEFEQRENAVYVQVTVQNAAAGTYAVHVHERADCSDIPGESMGGHFNPTNSKHGLPSDELHHLGDLGNMTVTETGTGSLSVLVPNASLKPGDEHSFLERALVIHSGRDDGGGESGHAGKPMACGPIREGSQ